MSQQLNFRDSYRSKNRPLRHRLPRQLKDFIKRVFERPALFLYYFEPISDRVGTGAIASSNQTVGA